MIDNRRKGKAMNIEDLLNEINDIAIFDSVIVANKKINDSSYKNIMCSVSGGSDSDIAIDICQKLDSENKISYVFFDTGLEYQATKEHLKYLESKYGIEIVVAKAKKPIPTCCKQYGQPFLSKQVSGSAGFKDITSNGKINLLKNYWKNIQSAKHL